MLVALIFLHTFIMFHSIRNMGRYMSNSIDGIEPEARWANQFNTGFRPHVIELVFYQTTGNDRKRILMKIVTSPDDARELLLNLSKTLEKYESMFGPIYSDGFVPTRPDKE